MESFWYAGVLYRNGTIYWIKTGFTSRASLQGWAKRSTAAEKAGEKFRKAVDKAFSDVRRNTVPLMPVISENLTFIEPADSSIKAIHRYDSYCLWYAVIDPNRSTFSNPVVSLHPQYDQAEKAAQAIGGKVAIASTNGIVAFDLDEIQKMF